MYLEGGLVSDALFTTRTGAGIVSVTRVSPATPVGGALLIAGAGVIVTALAGDDPTKVPMKSAVLNPPRIQKMRSTKGPEAFITLVSSSRLKEFVSRKGLQLGINLSTLTD